ncbi:MAG: hypothetical protein HQK77_04690 [Desulfobacterales bacterium]|nr:hypothetical protein [Desulfobacterales bacterium]
MMFLSKKKRGLLLILIILISLRVKAHSSDFFQIIHLKPGWNAFRLLVEPNNNKCDVIFKGLKITSVFTLNQSRDAIKDIPTIDSDIWAHYSPNIDSTTEKSPFFSLLGGESYLVHLDETESEKDLKIIGVPCLKPFKWIRDSYNLVGFPVSENDPPSFDQFFNLSSNNLRESFYRLESDGSWKNINPKKEKINHGEAYFIYSKSTSDYEGPIQIFSEERSRIDFSNYNNIEVLRIQNNSDIEREISISCSSQISPTNPNSSLTNPNHAAYKGFILDYQLDDQPIDENKIYNQWKPFSTIISIPIKPWQIRLLKLRFNRDDFRISDKNKISLCDMLEFRSSDGCLFINIPVLAETENNNGGDGIGYHGLWIGSVIVDKVCYANSKIDPNDPQQVMNEFYFRVLIHLGSDNKARLLQNVVELFKEGKKESDPSNPGFIKTSVPGRYVLVTNKEILKNFEGIAMHDGRPVARRYSSASFSFDKPIEMEKEGNFGKGSMIFKVEIPYDDRLNPFFHRYHPDHDNWDPRYEKQYGKGADGFKESESFSVTRKLTFTFSDEKTYDSGLIGGSYKEELVGLHKKNLIVSGKFFLKKVSSVQILNDEPFEQKKQ